MTMYSIPKNRFKKCREYIQPEMEIDEVLHKERSRLNVCKAFQSQELRKQYGKQ